ncbi:MAG: MazG nucleotide pyrophosphohydrolase domain-containing protein, partial [Ilumatobacteraceae bacterium]
QSSVRKRRSGGDTAGDDDDLSFAEATRRVQDEVGDLIFAVVNVARHLGVEPESALRAAVTKFRQRFDTVDALARERGIDLATSGLEVLDALWDEAKDRRAR